MAYQYKYDGNDDPRPEQRPAPTPSGGGQNDFGAWVLIGVMFLVAWPVGLILLIKKLSDNPKRSKRFVTDTAAHLHSKADEARQRQGRPAAQQSAQSGQQNTGAKSIKNVTKTPVPSAGSARALQIIGIILAALGGFALLNVLAGSLSYAVQYSEWWYLLRQLFYPTGLLAGGIAMLLGSGVMKKRMRRFITYLGCAGEQEAIPLAHLAKAAGVRENKAEQDLELMIEKGMWGAGAYLDRGNGMLFRSREAANTYLAARNVMAQPKSAVSGEETAPSEDSFADMLRAIRRANDRIDDEVLSAKIDRLEAITGKIFKVIREEPAKQGKASTFLNYYLPTTQKLLDSYADFEETGVSGQNLDQAKERIESIMDNIITGFEHQLDELYRDAAMDIDSDIRVMETMLRRDTATVADDFGLDGGTAVQAPDTEIE